MKRANTFEVVPQSSEDEELLRRLLDTSAALWNEINYERRENYADPDGDVWDISEYRGRYGGVLGASTVQQIERKNRHKDTLTCPCGFEGHADLAASETFLRRHQNSSSSDWRTRHGVSRQRQTTVTRSMGIAR